jgi:cold shock CspA family protein/ribosome-associated translation inhibitor RaiA
LSQIIRPNAAFSLICLKAPIAHHADIQSSVDIRISSAVTIPTKITYRNIDPSPAVEADIRKHAEKLEEFDAGIQWCNVSVEAMGKHQQKGRQYKIAVNLGLPGTTITANRAVPHDPAHADIYVAIRDAFNALGRQVEDHARIRRAEVKTHEAPESGRVIRLFPDEGYGFIETASGQEIYFHRNSVVEGAFPKLDVGSEVRLEIAYGESEKGPQATTVKPIGKHHIVS